MLGSKPIAKTQKRSSYACSVLGRWNGFIGKWIIPSLIAFHPFPNSGSSRLCRYYKVAVWMLKAHHGGTSLLKLSSKTRCRNGQRRRYERFRSVSDARNGRRRKPLSILYIGSHLDLSVFDARRPGRKRRETRVSPSVKQPNIYASSPRRGTRISGRRKTLWWMPRYGWLFRGESVLSKWKGCRHHHAFRGCYRDGRPRDKCGDGYFPGHYVSLMFWPHRDEF